MFILALVTVASGCASSHAKWPTFSDPVLARYKAQFLKDEARYLASEGPFFALKNPKPCKLGQELKERLAMNGKTVQETKDELKRLSSGKARAGKSRREYEAVDAHILEGECPVDGRLEGRVRYHGTYTVVDHNPGYQNQPPTVSRLIWYQVVEADYSGGVQGGEVSSYMLMALGDNHIKTDIGLVKMKRRGATKPTSKWEGTAMFSYGKHEGYGTSPKPRQLGPIVAFRFPSKWGSGTVSIKDLPTHFTSVTRSLGDDRRSNTTYMHSQKISLMHSKGGKPHGKSISYDWVTLAGHPVKGETKCYREGKEIKTLNCNF